MCVLYVFGLSCFGLFCVRLIDVCVFFAGCWKLVCMCWCVVVCCWGMAYHVLFDLCACFITLFVCFLLGVACSCLCVFVGCQCSFGIVCMLVFSLCAFCVDVYHVASISLLFLLDVLSVYVLVWLVIVLYVYRGLFVLRVCVLFMCLVSCWMCYYYYVFC